MRFPLLLVKRAILTVLSMATEKFDAFRKKYSYLDQGKYVAHAAPAVVFLQYATTEDVQPPRPN